MKKVIYTSIIGDYDELKEPIIKTKGWDYICFTDQDLKSDTWKIVKVGRRTVKEQRKKKIYNKYILDTYDLSIWIDGSMYVNTNLDHFVKTWHQHPFSLMAHPSRNCTYAEAGACISLGKDTVDNVMEQMDKYKKEGFPSTSGMVATGVMIREHTEEVKEFCRNWWREVDLYSHRDQLSFNYVAWKKELSYYTFPFGVLHTDFIITPHK